MFPSCASTSRARPDTMRPGRGRHPRAQERPRSARTPPRPSAPPGAAEHFKRLSTRRRQTRRVKCEKSNGLTRVRGRSDGTSIVHRVTPPSARTPPSLQRCPCPRRPATPRRPPRRPPARREERCRRRVRGTTRRRRRRTTRTSTRPIDPGWLHPILVVPHARRDADQRAGVVEDPTREHRRAAEASATRPCWRRNAPSRATRRADRRPRRWR